MPILVDMDEVLTDFTGAACAVHGTTREQLEENRLPGVWDIDESMYLTAEEFWEPINKLEDHFWQGLNELPWCDEVLEWVRSLETDWAIVTSPSWSPCSAYGKIRWLQRKFGEEFRDYVITPRKELLATSSTILVDDRPKNIQDFSKAGGRGILFPTMGNVLHKHADNPVSYLKGILQPCT